MEISEFFPNMQLALFHIFNFIPTSFDKFFKSEKFVVKSHIVHSMTRDWRKLVYVSELNRFDKKLINTTDTNDFVTKSLGSQTIPTLDSLKEL